MVIRYQNNFITNVAMHIPVQKKFDEQGNYPDVIILRPGFKPKSRGIDNYSFWQE